ncbi:hypothetical protein DFH29DRAFT_883260 [Suillus ampliporus]|nr:hypothetical protein DFH29DRAFT_883260 [Suillus ampliporus]
MWAHPLSKGYIVMWAHGDHSDLALEAAKAKWKVCEAEKHLADCILEHQAILLSLWRHCAEVANCHLLNADLYVGCMHMERKKSGIAAFARSDSGLMNRTILTKLFDFEIFVMTNACRLVLFVTLV